jgi:hypothetical protein
MIKENREVFLKLQEVALESQRREMLALQEEAILSPRVFSDEFERKMEKLLRYSKKPYFRFVNTVGKRVAMFAFVLIMALTIMTFSVQAFRESFFNFITYVGEVFTSVFFREVEQEEYPSEIAEVFLPMNLPEGYVLTEHDNFGNVVITRFFNGVDELVFEQTTMSAHLEISTEGAEFERLFVGNVEVAFTNNCGVNKIIWTDGLYGYVVFGVLERDCLLNLVVLSSFEIS